MRTFPKVFTILVVIGVFACGGCGKKDDKAAQAVKNAKPATKGEANPAATAPVATTANGAKGDAVASVAAKGTNFDPPIGKDRVPASAWYCDMGTVHYAQMDKGDAICPRCKMRLLQKGAP